MARTKSQFQQGGLQTLPLWAPILIGVPVLGGRERSKRVQIGQSSKTGL